MSDTASKPYRVLARKYRPATFSELIGQEAMVRTLSNAIAQGRIAQAFILTGVRGVGKTTTARIIARALNCIGTDGKGGPTIDPCGTCANCRAIAEDRHQDVMEMDAASRTGINDIREIIEAVRYAPVQARYKVYIIDEVHMLSTQAFNGLLKTLEEPPPHVKFIFATTEIRKVPVTVLSRCQRFDLRRVEADRLIGHFRNIAEKEGVKAGDEALRLIARAAEGSVRDGLSLLDQAIAHSGSTEGGEINVDQVRDMLGLADRARVFDLFETIMRGDLPAALASFRDQYDAGTDPGVIIHDLLELVHWLTRIKVVPSTADDVTQPEEARQRGKDLAARLSMPVLTRTWQMLLKGLGEVRSAPQPVAAAEMTLIRLAYVSDLPAPADVVKKLKEQGALDAQPRGPGGPAPTGGNGSRAMSESGGYAQTRAMPQAAPQSMPRQAEVQARAIPDFRAAVALFAENREMVLFGHLNNDVHLVRFEPGRIELRPNPEAPRNLVNQVAERLKAWSGRTWLVAVSQEQGEPTLKEQGDSEKRDRFARAGEHPLVQAVLAAFPGAHVKSVRDTAAVPPVVDQGNTGDDDEQVSDYHETLVDESDL